NVSPGGLQQAANPHGERAGARRCLARSSLQDHDGWSCEQDREAAVRAEADPPMGEVYMRNGDARALSLTFEEACRGPCALPWTTREQAFTAVVDLLMKREVAGPTQQVLILIDDLVNMIVEP